MSGNAASESGPTGGGSDGSSDNGGSGAISLFPLVALAIGGMVGGGIYVALGVVVEAAGEWAWLSFLIAGIVAVTTAHAYAALSNHFGAGGGAFEFLEEMDRRGAAGSLSWVLLTAYTLTIVSVNLLILLVLAGIGITGFWVPEALVPPGGPRPVWDAWMGAAAIFVAYEGFQLLTYEYEKVEDPDRILGPGLTGSASAVVLIYAAVAVGATMIAGAGTVMEQKGVALAAAAEQGAGTAGLVVITVATAFATSAAINSTLFSSAKLARRVADDGELPAWLDHRNDRNVPGRAVILLAALAAVLAWVGSLSGLVEAASLVFLAAFGVVHVVAWREWAAARWISGVAFAVGAVILVLLLHRLATTKPIPLATILVVFGVSFFGRPWLLKRAQTEDVAEV